MIKKGVLAIVVCALIYGIFVLYGRYQWSKEKKRRAIYYENLVDTASPTVTVLKDSIPIEYQGIKRTIHIYVPPNYYIDTNSVYPVIYMMDGESSFNDLANMGPEWQMDEVIDLAASKGEPTSIVIGIQEAEDRDAEYTPWINDQNPNAHGNTYAKWVIEYLKPWVDSHLRTNPSAATTTIGGISRSGMMAYYMMMDHPDIFGNAMIMSPSMWVDRERLMDMELPTSYLNNRKVYVSVGENEGNIMIPDAQAVYKKFANMGLQKNQLRYKIIKGEGHWHLTWRKSFADAYPWLVR